MTAAVPKFHRCTLATGYTEVQPVHATANNIHSSYYGMLEVIIKTNCSFFAIRSSHTQFGDVLSN